MSEEVSSRHFHKKPLRCTLLKNQRKCFLYKKCFICTRDAQTSKDKDYHVRHPSKTVSSVHRYHGLPYHHYYSLRKVSEMLPVNIDSAPVFGVVFQQNGKLDRIAGDNA